MSSNKVAELGRVGVTDDARKVIEQLKKAHGPLMFHLSGGCCDGSAPMCFQVGEFKLGGAHGEISRARGDLRRIVCAGLWVAYCERHVGPRTG